MITHETAVAAACSNIHVSDNPQSVPRAGLKNSDVNWLRNNATSSPALVVYPRGSTKLFENFRSWGGGWALSLKCVGRKSETVSVSSYLPK